MKSMFLSLLATVSFASNPVFASANGVLAEVTTTGGMPGPRGNASYSLQILEDGKVVTIQDKKEPVLILTLSSRYLSTVVSDVKKIQFSPLNATSSKAPLCQDAPTTKYWISSSAGFSISIGAVENCVESLPMVDSSESEALRSLLKNLRAIAIL